MTQRLGPGAWIDDQGNLHLDLVALCALVGEEPTPENQQDWMDHIMAQMREMMPTTPVMVREDDHQPDKYVPYNPNKRVRKHPS